MEPKSTNYAFDYKKCDLDIISPTIILRCMISFNGFICMRLSPSAPPQNYMPSLAVAVAVAA